LVTGVGCLYIDYWWSTLCKTKIKGYKSGSCTVFRWFVNFILEAESHSEDKEKFDAEKSELLKEIEDLKEQATSTVTSAVVPAPQVTPAVEFETQSKQTESVPEVESQTITREVIIGQLLHHYYTAYFNLT